MGSLLPHYSLVLCVRIRRSVRGLVREGIGQGDRADWHVSRCKDTSSIHSDSKNSNTSTMKQAC